MSLSGCSLFQSEDKPAVTVHTDENGITETKGQEVRIVRVPVPVEKDEPTPPKVITKTVTAPPQPVVESFEIQSSPGDKPIKVDRLKSGDLLIKGATIEKPKKGAVIKKDASASEPAAKLPEDGPSTTTVTILGIKPASAPAASGAAPSK